MELRASAPTVALRIANAEPTIATAPVFVTAVCRVAVRDAGFADLGEATMTRLVAPWIAPCSRVASVVEASLARARIAFGIG